MKAALAALNIVSHGETNILDKCAAALHYEGNVTWEERFGFKRAILFVLINCKILYIFLHSEIRIQKYAIFFFAVSSGLKPIIFDRHQMNEILILFAFNHRTLYPATSRPPLTPIGLTLGELVGPSRV